MLSRSDDSGTLGKLSKAEKWGKIMRNGRRFLLTTCNVSVLYPISDVLQRRLDEQETTFYPSFRTLISFAPAADARTTRVVDAIIIRIPSAESFPHKPSSAHLRIWTASTSFPGRERTTETLSSRTNMVAIRIHADTIPGTGRGRMILRSV